MVLHILFVDFKLAFDNVKRTGLYEAIMDLNIPLKLIKMARMTIENAKAKIKVDGKVNELFTFNKGVNQGDELSDNLFINALHYADKKVDQRGTIKINQASYVFMLMML